MIRVNIPQEDNNNITVVSPNNTISVNTKNSIVFSEDLSQQWATKMDGKVKNEDFSSKYYAKMSSESAEIAETNANISVLKNNELTSNFEIYNNHIIATATNVENSINQKVETAQQEINTVVNNSKQEINTTKNNAVTEINKEVTDGKKELNDIIEAGGSNINDKITNCLLEVPQRIKYTLVDGTLTTKAGSVVIVSYGTEDLTAQYPKGATFLHENFKVYDTQFADGKFFVWAELVSDVSAKPLETNIYDRFIGLDLLNNTYVRNNYVSSGTGDASGNWVLHYSTDKNIVMTTNGSGEIIQAQYGTTSLPFLIATGDGVNSCGSIKQVFNGFGHIGSTYWVDKGVKGLIPNSRNEDGSLGNIEYTQSRIKVETLSNNSTFYIGVGAGISQSNNYVEQEEEPTTNFTLWYKPSENTMYRKSGSGVVTKNNVFYGIKVTTGNGVITSFQPKLPFRAVNYNDISNIVENMGKGLITGQLVHSLLPLNDAGLHLLDGAVLDGNGIYKEFVNYIKGLYNASSTASYFVTETDWQTSVSNYGVCGKFVYNASANTVRLPKVTGILEGTIDANALGDLVEAGLPAHTHTRGTMNITGTWYQSLMKEYSTSKGTGALKPWASGSTVNSATGSGTGGGGIQLDASQGWTGSTSTPNYTADINTTGTVQPQTIKGYYYIVVATSTKTDIEVDIDNVVTDLNGKVNKSGDTMTGSLIIERSGANQVQIINTLMDKTTPPASTQYNQLKFGDKNNQDFGFIQCRQGTDGSHMIQLGAKHPTQNTYVTLGIGYDKDGNGYVSGTSPVKQYMAQMSMPSSKYIDLTLGASGTEYTAPANGWYIVSKTSTASGQYMNMINTTNNISIETNVTASGNWTRCYLPVKKGDKISISYSVAGTTNYFRFIYAEGEV